VAMQWPGDGLPENPRAWLTRVAFRHMSGHIRSESARRRRESEAALEMDRLGPPVDAAGELDQDDTLILLFMCCHPALTRASANALTLRAVGGLTTAEIAHAFLVPEPTMAQRISRAKQSIEDSRIPFQRAGAARSVNAGRRCGSSPLFESGHSGLAYGHLRSKIGLAQKQPAVIGVPGIVYEWTLTC
jgi:predicted RNA polymerase sigma factor